MGRHVVMGLDALREHRHIGSGSQLVSVTGDVIHGDPRLAALHATPTVLYIGDGMGTHGGILGGEIHAVRLSRRPGFLEGAAQGETLVVDLHSTSTAGNVAAAIRHVVVHHGTEALEAAT